MISAKGYSVNAATKAEKLPIIRQLIEYLTGAEVQEEMARKLFTTPVAVEAVKSTMAATQTAVESITKAAQQAAELAEANLKSLADAAANAARDAKKK